ncbi:MAG TPA: 50S ribosomal protein L4 [Candidatus Dormibacteraeota bacterium]|nr:50S ribosomal protein L4 [Candidatus Dormibacteraeota bacterium]
MADEEETTETPEATAETADAPKPRAPRKKAARAAEKKERNPLQVPYFDAAGEPQGEVMLPKVIFAERPNVSVMHQAYVRQMANARQGNASTKTRATVSGGGAKPYRQKGTGRARHGSTREPSMKGGGKVFGPKPRDFSQRMPKQMRRLALRSALSQKAIDGQVRVIESFGFEEPRTAEAAGLLDTIGFDDTTLVVLPAPNLVVSRSFENLAQAKIVLARNMNVRDLFTYTYLLLAKDSIELLVENFRKRSRTGDETHEHDEQEETEVAQ